MPRRHLHVVQLRLTSDEWRLVSEIARLRRLSVEDLLREGLRLGRHDAAAPPPERGRLQLVTPRRRAHPRRVR